MTQQYETYGRLRGRVAVVTGGTKGIGQGVVLRFLKEGASVVYCSRNPSNNAENAALIEELGAAQRSQFVAADVGSKSDMQGLVAAAAERFGRVDILVNNAQGIAPLNPIQSKPDGDYSMTLATGFFHSLWTSQAALPHMQAQRYGRIIHMSSVWSLWGYRYGSDYAVTKGALESLTRSMANEWGKFGVTVNCVRPAGDSFAYKQFKAQDIRTAAESEAAIPMGRMGDCEVEIAGAILGLVSENGRFITGQVLNVDGGLWAVPPNHEPASDVDIHRGRAQAAVSVGEGN
ncbi:MAG: SDR family oxidoreductase [Caulobacteraceae bacterium]|nr:SDR family oxidoreductase [Caulobacteraceae bacterium]